MIVTNGWTGDSREMLDLFKNREEKRTPFGLASFEEVLEETAAAMPEDYFLQYIRGMLSTNAVVSKEALEKAEKLQPQAAEPHFGRAILLRTVDAEAALREIDAALGRDPTQFAYWETKWSLLEDLQYRTLGPVHNAVRLQKMDLAEEVLKKKYGTKEVRSLFAEELAKDYALIHKPEQAAAVLEKAAEDLPDMCKHAAIISMREIGSLSTARKFFDCAFRQGWSVADKNLNPLWLEYQWRNGDYQQAVEGFANGVFRNRWTLDPAESLAALDTIGNILHAESRYDDAEKVLRAAKYFASQVTADPHDFWGPDYTVLPEKSRKWNWIVGFDLGLALLSRHKYAQAAGEFTHVREYLLRIAREPGRFRKNAKGEMVRVSFYDEEPELAFMTEMCRGYSYFKQGNYESAAQAWSSAFYPRLKYTGWSDHRKLEKVIEHDLTEDLQQFMKDPMHPDKTSIQPEDIVGRMFLLHRDAEARHFMERFILSMGDQPVDGWTARFLVACLQTHDLERVDQIFMEFVRSHSGGLTSKAAFAGLVTSLYPGVNSFYPDPGMLRTPNYFWDTISRDPYLE